MVTKIDNQHLGLKVALRETCISEAGIDARIVCETHGGLGRLGGLIYRHDWGMVLEKDHDRASVLAQQRPTWRVYCADSDKVLADGLAAEVAFTILDCDPYGQAWRTLAGFFESKRTFASTMAVSVTDGVRQKMRMGGFDMAGWEAWQDRFGPNLWDVYLFCCRERLTSLVAGAGYRVAWWHGQYSRTGQQTYFAAVLRRDDIVPHGADCNSPPASRIGDHA